MLENGQNLRLPTYHHKAQPHGAKLIGTLVTIVRNLRYLHNKLLVRERSNNSGHTNLPFIFSLHT